MGIGALLAVLVVGVAVIAWRPQAEGTPTTVARTSPGVAQDGTVLPVVDVYKDPTCGCCAKWVEHLQSHGFTVRTVERRAEELATLKTTHGVPGRLESCHTALVGGYVVEGHVPAADVQRLLVERPAIVGVAVAGMPVGSPGMEVPGVRAQPYDVMAFDTAGATRVFASYR